MITTLFTDDPIVDMADKLPACDLIPPLPMTDNASTLPFGLRFAVSPIEDGKHGKTYYTVTVNEPTQVSRDGRVVTQSDSVQRERED